MQSRALSLAARSRRRYRYSALFPLRREPAGTLCGAAQRTHAQRPTGAAHTAVRRQPEARATGSGVAACGIAAACSAAACCRLCVARAVRCSAARLARSAVRPAPFHARREHRAANRTGSQCTRSQRRPYAEHRQHKLVRATRPVQTRHQSFATLGYYEGYYMVLDTGYYITGT
jgi:hypothetical protein